MSERIKKILLIIGFIALIFIIGFLLYYLFFRPIITPPPLNQPPIVAINGFPQINLNTNQLPITQTNQPLNLNQTVLPALPETPAIPGPAISTIASGGLTSFNVLTEKTVYSPALAANGRDLIYYDKDDNYLYRLNPPTGQKQKFIDQSFANVQSIVWSNNQDKAVFEYPDGSNIIYDFVKKKSVTLPSQWKDFSFSPDGSQIAFKNMMLDPEERYIGTADTNGGDYTDIESLGTEDANVFVSWSPNNKYVALYREGKDANRSDVYPIGFNSENFVALRVEGRDLRFVWSPSGNILLYSAFNAQSDYNPMLWYVSTDPATLGSNRRQLDLATWADKCAFASETIVYCAVPRVLETGTGYIPSLADSTPDDFYRLNLATGNKALIAQPIYNTTVAKLFVSADESSLYWLEKSTGELKEINLK